MNRRSGGRWLDKVIESSCAIERGQFSVASDTRLTDKDLGDCSLTSRSNEPRTGVRVTGDIDFLEGNVA